MGKLETLVQIHNKFELDLYDANGNHKDKAYAYNVVLNRFWQLFFGNSLNKESSFFANIAIGTGTTTPDASNTSLGKSLGVASATLVSYTKEYPTSVLVQKATFGASTSLAGILTEVGFTQGSSTTSPFTRALLQDSEGNPITIEKTDTDILIVTATLYITVTAGENLELVPADSFGFLTQMRQMYVNSAHVVGYAYLSASPAYPSLSYIHSNSFSNGAGGDYTTRSRTLGATRVPIASGNRNGVGTYVNVIHVGSFGTVHLPNTQFFPVYTLQPMNVGIGDGATTAFVCPIPDFIEGTDKVVVDGVTLGVGSVLCIEARRHGLLCSLDVGVDACNHGCVHCCAQSTSLLAANNLDGYTDNVCHGLHHKPRLLADTTHCEDTLNLYALFEHALVDSPRTEGGSLHQSFENLGSGGGESQTIDGALLEGVSVGSTTAVVPVDSHEVVLGEG